MNINTYLAFFLFLTIFSTCQKKSEKLNLTGHWHVYTHDSTINTWDFIDSTEFIVNINSYNGMYTSSYFINKEDTVFHNVQFNHFEGNYKYEFLNDTLFLKAIDFIPVNDSTYLEYAGEIIAYAIRVDPTPCNLGILYIHILVNNNKLKHFYYWKKLKVI